MNLTLVDIIALCTQSYGARYAIDETTILKYINVIQQCAFNEDMTYFINWGYYLDIQDGTLTYTLPDGSDEDVPAGRKIIGVTSLTDKQLLAFLYPFNVSSLPGLGIDDYGWYGTYVTSLDNDRFKWITGRINNMAGTFTFLDQPNISDSTYRLVYYKEPAVIEADDEDEKLLIPDRLRYSLLVGGVGALANNALYGDGPTTPEQVLKPYLDSFWNYIIKANGPQPGDNWRTKGFMD